jgi:predicted nuclease of restriction endonuclease-like (RecB) superfamily
MSKSGLIPDDGYRELLEELKTRIRSSQLRAAISVNQEMTLLNWYIGREILVRQKRQGWGSKVINRLSQDLKREFPEIKGFSKTNLKYMRAFAEAWPKFEIGQQVLTNLPWGQNTVLLSKLDDAEERLWYAHKADENTQDQDLKRLLIAHMREFLLRLGVGFSFVGHHHHISVGGQDFYLDMLFIT